MPETGYDGMASASTIAAFTQGLTPDELLALNDQNHDSEIITYVVVFSILAIIATAVRVTSRHMKKVAVGIDDLLVIVALVGCSMRSAHLRYWTLKG